MNNVLAKGSEGKEVGDIQQILIEAGAAINETELRDQYFGLSTEEAVKHYQSAHNLTADGKIGPKTRAAFDGVGDTKFLAAGWRQDTAPAKLAEVFRQAAGLIGVFEVPAGSNRGELIDKWNLDAGIPLGSPWCTSGVSFVYGFADGGLPWEHPVGSAYKLMQWGLRRNRAVPATSRLRIGDVFIIMRGNFRGHVGLIVAVLEDGRVCTIEFNAGNAVRGLIRNPHDFTLVVRPVQVD